MSERDTLFGGLDVVVGSMNQQPHSAYSAEPRLFAAVICYTMHIREHLRYM